MANLASDTPMEVLEEEDRTIDRMTLEDFCLRNQLHIAKGAGPDDDDGDVAMDDDDDDDDDAASPPPPVYKHGAEVIGDYNGEWFPCTVRESCVVNGQHQYTVDWGDGTETTDMLEHELKPKPGAKADKKPGAERGQQASESNGKKKDKDAGKKALGRDTTALAKKEPPMGVDKKKPRGCGRGGVTAGGKKDLTGDAPSITTTPVETACTPGASPAPSPLLPPCAVAPQDANSHTTSKPVRFNVCDLLVHLRKAAAPAAVGDGDAPMPDAATAGDGDVLIDAAVAVFRGYLRAIVHPAGEVAGAATAKLTAKPPPFRLNVDCAWDVDGLRKLGVSAALAAACADGAVGPTTASSSRSAHRSKAAKAKAQQQQQQQQQQPIATGADGLTLLRAAAPSTVARMWLEAAYTAEAAAGVTDRSFESPRRPAPSAAQAPLHGSPTRPGPHDSAAGGPDAGDDKTTADDVDMLRTPSAAERRALGDGGSTTKAGAAAAAAGKNRRKTKDKPGEKAENPKEGGMKGLLSRFVVVKKRESRREAATTFIEPYVRRHDARYDGREIAVLKKLEDVGGDAAASTAAAPAGGGLLRQLLSGLGREAAAGDADVAMARPPPSPVALRERLQAYFAEHSTGMLHEVAPRGGASCEIVAHRDGGAGDTIQYVGSYPEPTAKINAVWPVGEAPPRDYEEVDYDTAMQPDAARGGASEDDSSGSSLSDSDSDDSSESAATECSYIEEESDDDDEMLFTKKAKKGKKKKGGKERKHGGSSSDTDSNSSSGSDSDDDDADPNRIRLDVFVDPANPTSTQLRNPSADDTGETAVFERADGGALLAPVCPVPLTTLMTVPFRDFFYRNVLSKRVKHPAAAASEAAPTPAPTPPSAAPSTGTDAHTATPTKALALATHLLHVFKATATADVSLAPTEARPSLPPGVTPAECVRRVAAAARAVGAQQQLPDSNAHVAALCACTAWVVGEVGAARVCGARAVAAGRGGNAANGGAAENVLVLEDDAPAKAAAAGLPAAALRLAVWLGDSAHEASAVAWLKNAAASASRDLWEEFRRRRIAVPTSVDLTRDVFDAKLLEADATRGRAAAANLVDKSPSWDAKTLIFLMELAHISPNPSAYIVDTFREMYPLFRKTTVGNKLREIAVRQQQHWVVRQSLLEQHQLSALLAKHLPTPVAERPAKIRRVTLTNRLGGENSGAAVAGGAAAGTGGGDTPAAALPPSPASTVNSAAAVAPPVASPPPGEGSGEAVVANHGFAKKVTTGKRPLHKVHVSGGKVKRPPRIDDKLAKYKALAEKRDAEAAKAAVGAKSAGAGRAAGSPAAKP